MSDPYFKPHKQCRTCPFRITSVRGWFGPYSPQHYLDAAMSELGVVCHETSQLPADKMRHCTGVALFRAKCAKLPRSDVQQQHQQQCIDRYGTAGVLDYTGFRAHHHMDDRGSGLFLLDDNEEDT